MVLLNDKILLEGDTVYLKDKKNSFFIKLKKDKIFMTHKGIIPHNEIIGKKYGDIVFTHKGEAFKILKPTIYEIIMYGIKRETQIIYPKDAGYIILKLGLRKGMRVLEVGIGSGALTIVMANVLSPTGVIHAYEKEERFIKIAIENLKLAEVENIVKIHHKDIIQGIEEKDFDAGFIDLKEPWLYIETILKVLKKGVPIGFILPTVNQVIKIIQDLQRLKFFNIEVEEILNRPYKPVPERLRPVDKMSAHTGYLIFARTPF